MKVIILLMIFIVGLSISSKAADDAKQLRIGDTAPDFKLRDDGGKWRALSEFKGKQVVVYFYPKDDTPGCTREACGFRDNYKIFEEKGIVVLGISFDSIESHRNFKKKYQLPFILLSDEKKEVTKAYGASGGLIQLFPKRITYVIDEGGKIVRIFDQVAVTEHAGEVLAVFEEIAKQKTIPTTQE